MKNYYSKDYKPLELSDKKGIYGAGGGGGSCFPTNTLIRTHRGYKCIQHLTQQDLILGFASDNNIEYGVLTDLIEHKAGTFTDDLYFFFSEELNLFPTGVTGNHAIFISKTNKFIEAKDVKRTHKLQDLKGNSYPITKIKMIPKEAIGASVWGLEVEPLHTFFAGPLSIKVHNGGGGKAGGSGAPPRHAQEDPNTLRSSAIARVLELISHGPCVGVVGGRKGTELNATAIDSQFGQPNIPNIVYDERTGTPSQTIIPGFINTELEITIPATEVKQSVPVVHQLVNSNIQAARVTLRLPTGLYTQDTSNGDLKGYRIGYSIQIKDRLSPTWTTVIAKNIFDKTTSPWEIAHLISAPAGAVDWDIQVIKTVADDVVSSDVSKLEWVRLTEITFDAETYDNLAIVGLQIPAESVGNSIPSRAYNYMGLIVQVPDNYDPATRTYSGGFWSGLFKSAWTDNPVWVLYDLLTNPEYGVQNFLGQTIDVDIFQFFNAALYCDATTWNGSTYVQTLINDGLGGTEVRFTFNQVINTQTDAWQLLHAVASNFRAVLTFSDQQVSLLQDRPRQISQIFTNANVIDGLFNYSGVDVGEISTEVHVTYNDKSEKYLPTIVSEQADPVFLTKYGLRTKNIVAYGVTSQSQAKRFGKWAIYTETHQTDQVTFAVGLNIASLAVGDVVGVLDNDFISNTNIFLGGRIKSITGSTVELDRAVQIDSGFTYEISFPNLTRTALETHTINSTPGTISTLTLATTPPAGNYTNYEFYCFSSGHIEARPFIIQSITESEKGNYAISGLFEDVNKYAIVEQGLVVVPGNPFSLITVLPPVENILFQEIFLNTGNIGQNSILVTWDWDTANTIKDPVTFILRWRRDSGPYTVVNDIVLHEYSIPSVVPGVYDVIITVQNIQGKKSTDVFSTFDYRTTSSTSTLLPPINFFVQGTQGTAFINSHLALQWSYPPNNAFKSDTLLDYLLEIWATDGSALLAQYVITPDVNKGGLFDYTIALNINDYGTPSRTIQIKLYSRDIIGDRSLPIVRTFTNAVPAIVSFSLLTGVNTTYIDVTSPQEIDHAGYLVYRDTVSGFTPGPSNLVYTGPDTYIVLNGTSGTTYHYVLAAFDTFGKTGLNLSSEQSTTHLTGNLDIWTFTGLTLQPNDPGIDQVSWTAGTASKNGGAAITINAGNATWTTGILYLYYDGTSNTLLADNDLTIAVQGVQILATYKGGTQLINGNSQAFVDGGLLLAGTVGASQLVAGSAIITNTLQLAAGIIDTVHIGDGVVTNLKIGNIIQSLNFSDTNKLGFKIDKASNIKSYGALELLDQQGNTILTTGANAQIQWNAVGGANVPQNNATVGAALQPTVGTPTEQAHGFTANSTLPTGGQGFTQTATATAYTSSAVSSQGYGTPTTGVILRFVPTSINANCYVGLNNNPNTNNGFANINFGFDLQPAGVLKISEANNDRGIFGTYTASSVLEIKYDGTVITYHLDGNLLRTLNVVTPGTTFYLDSSLSAVGEGADNVEFNHWDGTTETPSLLTLVNNGNATITTGNSATISTSSTAFSKDTGSGSFDVSIYSTENYTDLVIRFKVNEITTNKKIGLDQNPAGINGDLAYYFNFLSNGNVEIKEGSTLILALGAALTTDVFAIQIDTIANTVEYFKNAVSQRVSTLIGAGTYFLDSLFDAPGGINSLELKQVLSVGGGAANVTGQITQSNVLTYIANAAIPNAVMGTASIDTANIQNAAVQTLSIAGQAVSVAVSAAGGSLAMPGSLSNILNLVITTSGFPTAIFFSVTLATSSIMTRRRLVRNGAVIVDSITTTTSGTSHTDFVVATQGPGTWIFSLQVQGTLGSILRHGMYALETKR